MTSSGHWDHRRYDAYARNHEEYGDSELIPAATVVVLRDTETGLETLMLRRNSKIAFGGMWVFPGGRIDEEDVVAATDGQIDELTTAAAAAAREASEEASVVVDPKGLVWFAHWVPPLNSTHRRYATFFFAARLDDAAGPVTVDEGEITEHEWMRPDDALARRDAGEIELAPPTWMTLHRLDGFGDVTAALTALTATEPTFYETHMARTNDGPVAMWEGDAGYEDVDPSRPGPRHRLTMAEDRYSFQDDRT
ncbi:MAG: NUDIX domain-containing protein [Actinomycetota bacterium]|nr:NUDIX domain-containing protein [Actinomycetota bacterium]MED5167338.1 NUDIX domain-containing protein [Actinomycetota bacterium]